MTGRESFSMGTDSIRYLLFVNGKWRWRPTRAMRAAGFRLVNLSVGVIEDGKRVPSLADKKQALQLNEDWDRHRRGLPARSVAEHTYSANSVGASYLRAMKLRALARAEAGKTWTKSITAATIGHAPGGGSSRCLATATRAP